jgi:hypothetical protein
LLRHAGLGISGRLTKENSMLGFYRVHNSATVRKPRRSQLKGWMMCLKFRAGLLCGKWLVIGTLLAVALHGNLYAQSFRAAASAGVTSGTTLTINIAAGDVLLKARSAAPQRLVSASLLLESAAGGTLLKRGVFLPSSPQTSPQATCSSSPPQADAPQAQRSSRPSGRS